MNDISNFLLARISEDEAWWCEGSAEYGDCDVMSRRLHTEAKVKRKIIKLAHIWIDSDRTDTYATASRQELSSVLTQMLVPYRNHPDCDPKWLPAWANWPTDSAATDPTRSA